VHLYLFGAAPSFFVVALFFPDTEVFFAASFFFAAAGFFASTAALCVDVVTAFAILHTFLLPSFLGFQSCRRARYT
jgi:hypothetical protein